MMNRQKRRLTMSESDKLLAAARWCAAHDVCCGCPADTDEGTIDACIRQFAAALLAVVEPCETCGGQGVVQTGENIIYVSHEMAMDAQDLRLARSGWLGHALVYGVAVFDIVANTAAELVVHGISGVWELWQSIPDHELEGAPRASEPIVEACPDCSGQRGLDSAIRAACVAYVVAGGKLEGE
jgi:hypothetical protein